MENDLTLVEKIGKGDPHAWDQLYSRYRQQVRGFLRARGCRGEDCEDVEQETWIDIFQRVGEYDANRSSVANFIRFRAWVQWKRHLARQGRRSEWESLDREYPEWNDSDRESSQDILEALPDTDPSPEWWVQRNAEYEALFKATFRGGGYPHQLIAFGYNKLVDGWTPIRITEELSERWLETLGQELEQEIIHTSSLPEALIRDSLRPLHEQMPNRLDEVLSDPASRQAYAPLLAMKTGETVLQQYYGKDPARSIADWTFKVKQRVLRELALSGY
jgi:DNA-directed RNA polymerase specialized sigma24 family protein